MLPCDILRSGKQWKRVVHAPGNCFSFRLPILLVVLLVPILVLLGWWSRVELPELSHEQKTNVQLHLERGSWNSTNSINKDPGLKATSLSNRTFTINKEQGLGATSLSNKSSAFHEVRGLKASSLSNRTFTINKEQGFGATSLGNKSSAFHEVRGLEEASRIAQEGKMDDGPYHNWELFNMDDGPYHNWELFDSEYQEMLQKLKIFVYPDAFMHNQNQSSPFAEIFLPHPNPYDPKFGNYFSEHAFKITLLESPLITKHPEEAQFFFLPFSINAMRNHPRLHSESSISDFVAQYTTRISSEFRYWNASGGADHFYICCHSVGREAASKHHALYNNAIQVTCSSSYFQRLYVTHKDIALPQVWPRQAEQKLNPPDARTKLVFFAGRVQNSRVRKILLDLWNNDSSFDIFSRNTLLTYQERFRRSKFCLHVKGYEVNTARISDAIHYGCIPVIISNYYDLPFANVLDWNKFSVIVSHEDIANLKNILLSVSNRMYLRLFKNLCLVRRHFVWHKTPVSYDSFYMTAYQLWRRRGSQHLSYSP